MSAVEESKALVQRAQKLSVNKVASESDCSERESKSIFHSSEGSNNNDEGLCNNNDEGHVQSQILLWKIVIIMMKIHVQSQMIGYYHVLKRQNC